jgi:hypothetical protein
MKLRFFEARRYFLAASKTNEEYLVDLEENNGAGKCSCPDYSIRVQPEVDAGRPGRDCKHLSAARKVEQFSKDYGAPPGRLCQLINELMQ